MQNTLKGYVIFGRDNCSETDACKELLSGEKIVSCINVDQEDGEYLEHLNSKGYNKFPFVRYWPDVTQKNINIIFYGVDELKNYLETNT